MKKFIGIFLLVIVYATITSCNSKTSINNKNNSNSLSYQISNSSDNLDNSSNHSSNTKDITPLNASDFVISDGINSVKLDSPFKDLKINKPEEKLDTNYVGETTSGKYIYKTYIHKYADFDLYVSNLNYNLKNRNFDEYYITQITLKSNNFKTNRGITIDSKLEDVYAAYGNIEKTSIDGKELLNYTLNDMILSFTIDKNEKVQSVILMIKPQ